MDSHYFSYMSSQGSDLYWIFKSISDTLERPVNVTCWNLAASVSLGADEDQAEPSSYPSRSGIQSCKLSCFPFHTMRVKEDWGESHAGGEATGTSWRTSQPQVASFPAKEPGLVDTKSRKLFSGFWGTNFAKSRILGSHLRFSAQGRKSSLFAIVVSRLCTINQHLWHKTWKFVQSSRHLWALWYKFC